MGYVSRKCSHALLIYQYKLIQVWQAASPNLLNTLMDEILKEWKRKCNAETWT